MKNSIHISELEPGDQVMCWMRLGLAIKTAQRGDGSLYRYVPYKPTVAGPGDLTRFSSWVVLNQPDKKLISLQVTRNDSHKIGFNREQVPLVADVSYTAFQRMRKLSEISHEPKSGNPTFPANFKDAAYRPYKTLIEVRLV